MSEASAENQIVVVGAGQAGAETATALRRQGFEGQITIVGEEPYAPYKRPPLSKTYLSGDVTTQSLAVLSPAALEKANLNLITGVAVTRIDREARQVHLADGRELKYSKLMLSTGGRPRMLNCAGADLPGVFALRGIEDVDAIRKHFVKGARVVIVGGGYIGLEVAAVARKCELTATVLESMPRVLQRVTAPVMSEFYERVHREAGVDVRTGVGLDHFEAAREGLAVVLADGSRIEADFAVVGIGLIPNTELAAEAGLEVDNGIVVNEFTQTSDPDIFSAGDCTNHPSEFLGRRIRLESVQNAMEAGRAAAANMLGKETIYSNVPWFWSDQYDLKLQMVGMSAGYDDVVLRGSPEGRSFGAFYLKDGVVIAADMVSRLKEFMVAKKMVAAKVRVEPAKLSDEDTALADILAATQS